MKTDQGPPPILDCAVVLAYAIHDNSVEYTGSVSTYLHGLLIGPEVRNSAICRNLANPKDYLFIYCDADWNGLAAVGHETFAQAENCAVRNYSGLDDLLVRTSYTEDEIEKALGEYWDGRRCSICCKWPHEVEEMILQNDKWICDKCT